jgi:hypothetical protein
VTRRSVRFGFRFGRRCRRRSWPQTQRVLTQPLSPSHLSSTSSILLAHLSPFSLAPLPLKTIAVSTPPSTSRTLPSHIEVAAERWRVDVGVLAKHAKAHDRIIDPEPSFIASTTYPQVGIRYFYTTRLGTAHETSTVLNPPCPRHRRLHRLHRTCRRGEKQTTTATILVPA